MNFSVVREVGGGHGDLPTLLATATKSLDPAAEIP